MSCAYRNVLMPLSLSLVLFLYGCAFQTLEKELTALEQVHVLTGSIVNRTCPDSHVEILLYALSQKPSP